MALKPVEGKLVAPDGTLFEGTFVDGQPREGTLFLPKLGVRYTGTLETDGCDFHGQGTLRSQARELVVYDGNWVHGKPTLSGWVWAVTTSPLDGAVVSALCLALQKAASDGELLPDVAFSVSSHLEDLRAGRADDTRFLVNIGTHLAVSRLTKIFRSAVQSGMDSADLVDPPVLIHIVPLPHWTEFITTLSFHRFPEQPSMGTYTQGTAE